MPRTDLNRRLSTTDASFFYVERPAQPMHIGSCNVYETRIGRDQLIAVLRDRMHLLPRYRQRAVFPPFGLSHPTWEDDPEFDLANHVEEIELPAPADDRTISEAGGDVFGRMLDRNRPLWKLVALHGHADGGTRLIAMVHHAMVDGISGVELQMVLHDLTPDAAPPAPPPAPWQPRPLPDPLSLFQDAVRDRLTAAANRWTDDTFRLLRPREVEQRTRQLTTAVTTAMPSLLQPAPRLPFNGAISPGRRFGWLELAFAELRFIRSALGGTVNDVVLTIIAGGMGRYLRNLGMNTAGMVPRAMCPVSMRRPDEQDALGNLVSMMIAPLYVDIIDPVERLQAERKAMEDLKQQDQAGGLYEVTRMADVIPPAWQAFAGRFDVPNTLINTVSTNVPGPQIPIYLGGVKLVSWYPMGPLASGIGLFNAILSYNQKITIGATVDPKLMPDVWVYVDGLRASFEELLAAARTAAEAAAAPPPTEVTIPEPRGRKAAAGKARSRRVAAVGG